MWRNSPPFWANRYGWFGRTCKSLRKVFLKRFYSRKTVRFIRAINSASDSFIFSAKSSGDCGFKGISKPKVCIVPPKPLSTKVLFSSAPFSFSFRGKIKPGLPGKFFRRLFSCTLRPKPIHPACKNQDRYGCNFYQNNELYTYLISGTAVSSSVQEENSSVEIKPYFS